MSDPLADIVALLQPRAPYSKVASGSGAWRVDREGEGKAFYCVLMEGSALLEADGHDALELAAGDFVLVPAAFRFSVSNIGEPGEWSGDPARVTLFAGETRHGDPHGPANARMLVGHFDFGSPDTGLLVSLLPRLIHVRGQPRLARLVELVTDEARASRPAGEMILARLLEVMLIEALRTMEGEAAPPGLLRGLSDERLSLALRRLHQDPARAWTVEQMAREAALSRAVFFNRFRGALGRTPMDYLGGWRIALSKKLLLETDLSMQQIAERIGYGSASAFSSAFARSEGIPPSQFSERLRRDGHLAAAE